jgi:hypothetical protein
LKRKGLIKESYISKMKNWTLMFRMHYGMQSEEGRAITKEMGMPTMMEISMLPWIRKEVAMME